MDCAVGVLAVCLSFRQIRLGAFHPKTVYQLDVLLLGCNKIFRFQKKCFSSE
jgi:hypothetical protein